MVKPSIRATMGVAATLWAAFLLPPQLIVWAPSDTPDWIARLANAGVYEWFSSVGASVGLTDAYFLYGAGVAPSFLLIGLVLAHVVRGLGWTGRLFAGLTLAGTALVVVSYAAENWQEPWRALWGVEAVLFMAIGLTGLAAGIAAFRRGIPRSSAALLALTPIVIVVSTLLIRYYPHGTLIGMGLQAAVLGLMAREPDPAPALAVTA
ncbi:MAG TPA: hypothetical protein VF377_01280 [Acidimicrobiia bacterium]|jgi:hypothetical protein